MSDRDAQPGGYRTEAEDLLADLAARLEAGEGLDWDELATEHPALRDELARLRAGWRSLDGLLRSFGMDGRRPAFEQVAPHPASVQALRAFERRRALTDRYELGEPIGRGGMAEVRRAWDHDLRRHVAMKLCHDAGSGLELADSAGVVARFLEEAQVTGRLMHPGIVPVHDIGMDAGGRAFFTMELVEGETLDTVFALAREDVGGWSVPRALEVLVKVCDALAYAHSRGVLHRDLKPANVMVGRFGDVRVMDWGLARAEGRDAPASRRTDESAGDSSALVTEEGAVLGTPAYMSPEQAAGRFGELDARTDVYAVGAMLYALFAGHAPHAASGAARREVLRRLEAGPPPPLERVAPRTPPELAAICERAMAREPARRYGDVRALAEDLRRHLEGRAVLAHRTGAWVELRKWVARNRALAASLAAVLLAVTLGVLLDARAKHRRATELAQLVLGQRFAALREEADELWPAFPERVPELEDWLRRARLALARLPAVERDLDALRARAGSSVPASAAPDERTRRLEQRIAQLRSQRDALERGLAEMAARAGVPHEPEWDEAEWLERVQAELADLEGSLAGRRRWRFASSEDQYRHDRLVELLQRAVDFVHPEDGLVAEVEARLDDARTLAARSVGVRAEDWRGAIEAVAASPRYGGLRIEPQMGLVPLGSDPASGLFEFADVQTGEVPRRGADGRLELTEESGLVFVLVPGGLAVMGALCPPIASLPGPFFDPRARRSESPPRPLVLDAFLLSKYEMTQGQWLRATGANPSRFQPGGLGPDGRETTLLNPVERVSWHDCRETLWRLGMRLPTDAQWEHAARGGTFTVRWTGDSDLSLQGAENLRDLTAAARNADEPAAPEVLLLDDGWAGIAYVGSFRANPWGFHDVLGNVSEWCEDVFVVDTRWPARPGDGLRLPPEDFPERVRRGGNHAQTVRVARSAMREAIRPDQRAVHTGLRPARALE